MTQFFAVCWNSGLISKSLASDNARDAAREFETFSAEKLQEIVDAGSTDIEDETGCDLSEVSGIAITRAEPCRVVLGARLVWSSCDPDAAWEVWSVEDDGKTCAERIAHNTALVVTRLTESLKCPVDQRWVEESTIWTLPDGSKIRVSGSEVSVFEPTTIGELRAEATGGLIATDRGNGAAGPHYIDEDDDSSDDTRIRKIDPSDDPEAWALLKQAAADLSLTEPTVCYVTARGIDSSGHQMIVGY